MLVIVIVIVLKEWGRRSRGATVRLESLGEVILLFVFVKGYSDHGDRDCD